jgi:PAS domain S-box-containing protein
MNPSREATSEYFLRLQRKVAITAIVLAVVVIVLALIVFTGHLLNSIPLIGFPFTKTGMNPMMALGFLLSGTAILFYIISPGNNTIKRCCQVMGILLIVLGLGRLIGAFNLFDLQFDMLLFRDRFKLSPEGVMIGRTTYTTSTLLLLTGTGILLRVSKRRPPISLQYFLFAIILVSLFTLIAIIYGVSNFNFFPLRMFRMALNTSICFLLLAITILLSAHRYGIMALITSPKMGGRIARSFLPLILFFPALLGVIHVISQRSQLFEHSLGLALFSIISMMVFFALIVRTARLNNETSKKLETASKERIKAEVQASNADLFANTIVENIPNMVFVKDGKNLRFKSINKAGEQMLGFTRDQLAGKSDFDIFPKKEAEFFRAKDEEAFATGEPVVIDEELITTQENGVRWVRTKKIGIRDEQGKPLYMIGIVEDITELKQKQELLDRRTTERFEAIFNSQYQFMGLMTTDGILIECNETALNFAGIQAHDVIGKHFWECYWWAISERVQNQLRQSIARAARGEFIRYEADILGKGGIIATIDFSIKPVLDEQGNVTLLIPEGRDITQRKLLEQRAREQEEQIRLFVKHTPAAIAMFDSNMRYMVASDRWYKDYGLEGREIIGKSHYKVFPEIDNMPAWKEMHQRCLAGEVVIKEQDLFVRANGATDWLRFEIYPWRTSNDKIGGIIMFTEVITDKIKVQEDLKKLNNKLVESNKELEQFAYVASHDLQEPLRMVSSFLQLLEKKYKSQLDETAHQYIHFAVDGSERMKTLINDLLKFSRVGTTAEEHVDVDCNTSVKNVIKVYEQKINESGAKIKMGKLPIIKANKTQIEQLFQNLIGNALKYRRDENPCIDIGAKEDGNRWVFHVRDNGIGIEKKFFEKVFVIFQRLHGKNEYGGTGIGLAICKKIVERHGGKIWIESEPGHGTTFYFSFPMPEATILIDQA